MQVFSLQFRNTEWAETKIKTVPHMFCDSAEVHTYGIDDKM